LSGKCVKGRETLWGLEGAQEATRYHNGRKNGQKVKRKRRPGRVWSWGWGGGGRKLTVREGAVEVAGVKAIEKREIIVRGGGGGRNVKSRRMTGHLKVGGMGRGGLKNFGGGNDLVVLSAGVGRGERGLSRRGRGTSHMGSKLKVPTLEESATSGSTGKENG